MEKLSIDGDFDCQWPSVPDGVTCRVFVPSKDRHVDLFWPGDSKRFRDSLHPNKSRNHEASARKRLKPRSREIGLYKFWEN